MASGPIPSWEIDGETVETVSDFIFLGSKITTDGDYPIDGKPTRLPHPWDSPGKNTGVSCHFLLQCMSMGILQERILDLVAISSPRDRKESDTTERLHSLTSLVITFLLRSKHLLIA